MEKKELVLMATFGQPQGLKGDVKINIFTSSLESFKNLKNFFIENDPSPIHFKKIKIIGKKTIATLEGCKDRDAALKLKGKNIFVSRESFPKINNNEHYVIDLIKCKVLDKKNIYIGDVVDIKNFGAGDLIEIKNDKNDKKQLFYIPMNNENLINIDIKRKIILVNPIQGLLD